MGNLGWYQKTTTIMKKVGGPKKAIALVMASGYVLGKGIEITGKAIVDLFKDKNKVGIQQAPLYEIKEDAISNEGVALIKGMKIRILEQDKDAVQIEIIGDNNNPYFVSYDLISKITEYKEIGENK